MQQNVNGKRHFQYSLCCRSGQKLLARLVKFHRHYDRETKLYLLFPIQPINQCSIQTQTLETPDNNPHVLHTVSQIKSQTQNSVLYI